MAWEADLKYLISQLPEKRIGLIPDGSPFVAGENVAIKSIFSMQ
jgi:hypothetical protein